MAVIVAKNYMDVYYEVFKKIFQKDFPEIEVEYFFYEDYKDAPELIEERQKEFDAIIFGGAASYRYALSKLRTETMWFYLPWESNDIYHALLMAHLKGFNIKKLSFDTYEREMLINVYAELGISENELQIYCFNENAKNPEHNERAFRFHQKYIREKKVEGCITRLVTVTDMLKDAGLPYVFAYPTRQTIYDVIEKAYRLVIAKKNSRSEFAIFNIDIGVSDAFSSAIYNNYDFAMQRLKVAGIIYQFADRVKGAVLEEGMRNYIIISTKQVVDEQLEGYRKFSLLEQIEEICPYQIYIGIGYGETIVEAHQFSSQAVQKAHREPVSNTMVRLVNGEIIRIGEENNYDFGSNTVIENYKIIAGKAEISVNTLEKIANFLVRTQKECVTCNELAIGMGISRRNAGRVLKRLEEAGYAWVVGKKMTSTKGRPAEVLKIALTQEKIL